MEDRYEILDVVASGAAATVWRARDVRLERTVAIKRPSAGRDTESAAFTERARSAASVTHPNLVTIFDTGTDETGPFLVMELVEGPNLAEAGGSPRRPASLGADIAAGLSALHAAGAAHGDVRPSNVLLGPTGPKLTDFGTARIPEVSNAADFVAPEVLAGGDASEAADVFALGSLLSWLAARDSFDPALARVIDDALSEDPSERPTAAAIAARLREISAPGSTGPPAGALAAVPAAPTGDDATRHYDEPLVPSEASDAEPTSPSRRRRVALVVALAAIAVVAAMLALADGDEPEPLAGATTSTLDPTATTTTSPPDTSPSEEAPTEEGGVFETVRTFIVFIREAPGNVLDRTDAEQIVSDVVDGVSEAIRGNEDEATSSFSDAVENVEEIDSETMVDRAIDLIGRIAGQLGLDVERIFEGPDPGP